MDSVLGLVLLWNQVSLGWICLFSPLAPQPPPRGSPVSREAPRESGTGFSTGFRQQGEVPREHPGSEGRCSTSSMPTARGRALGPRGGRRHSGKSRQSHPQLTARCCWRCRDPPEGGERAGSVDPKGSISSQWETPSPCLHPAHLRIGGWWHELELGGVHEDGAVEAVGVIQQRCGGTLQAMVLRDNVQVARRCCRDGGSRELAAAPPAPPL